MKLSVVEWCILILTGLFLTFVAGYFAGTQNAGSVAVSGTVLVETETTPPSADGAEDAGAGETPAAVSDAQDAAPVQAVDQEADAAASDSTDTDGRININTAGAEELESLPGIGEALAQRIIAYREEYGPFASVEEILNVSGIGAGKFASIQDLITVG